MSHLSLANTLGLGFYQVSHPSRFSCGGCSVVGCDPAGTGQWDVDPQKPSDKSAWLTAQVGNEDQGPHSFPCHWFKPPSPLVCLLLCRPPRPLDVHCSCPGTHRPLAGLWPAVSVWESFSGLAGCGKGAAKQLALYVYFLNSTKQD